MKRKIPATSLEAYRSLDPNKLSYTHRQIIEALTVLGTGNYEQIAAQCDEPEAKIWKRLNEVCKLGAIHNTGNTTLTKNKCKSYIYGIGPGTEVKKKERVMKGKTISDFSKALNQPKQAQKIQDQLF